MKILFYLFIALNLCAQTSQTKLKADVYFDYFYSLNNHSVHNNMSGFSIRRIYLTIDHNFSTTLSSRLRYEVKSNYFKKSGKLFPFIKDAYLKWKISDNSKLIAGIQKHPSLINLEKFYGLRHIEKTPSDLYKILPSRKTGLSYNTAFSKHINWVLFYGNRTKSNSSSLLISSLNFKSKTTLLEISASHRSEKLDIEEITFQSFIAKKFNSFKTILSFHFRRQKDYKTKEYSNMQFLSLFAQFNFKKDFIFIRLDRAFDGIPKNPDFYSFQLNEIFTQVLFGYEKKFNSGLSLTPNANITVYDNSELKTDFIGKITLRFKWK